MTTKPARPKASGGEVTRPSTACWLAPALFAAVLAIAPPLSNSFWGVNALRLATPWAAALVALAAAASALLVRIRGDDARVRWAVGIGFAWLVSHPLRERIHFLGDTQLRVRSLALAHSGWIPMMGEWWNRLHANPLDIAVNVLGVYALQKLGLSVIQAVSLMSWLLCVAFLAGAWRLAGRVSSDRSARWGLAAAVAVSGVLEAFAGYPESAGIVAVTVMWWWAETAGRIASREQAWRIAVAFVALCMAHRVGVVMAVPLLWRALGPAMEGDEAKPRRTLVGVGAAAIALVVATTLLTRAGGQLMVDSRDLLASALRGHAGAADILNALALVAPLALLVPFAIGGRALIDWLRSPIGVAILLASLPLSIALLWLYPIATYSLGPLREWEANLLPGVTLTAASAALLGRLRASARRRALAAALPVLTLVAGGWLAVNADVDASTRRAIALAQGPSTLNRSQLGSLHAYLGQRALDVGQVEAGAREFELAFEVGGNPRRELMACQAWLQAGDLAEARRALAAARARGPFNPELAAGVSALDAMLARAAADSARAAAGSGP